jgi:prophage tail gpP-like protein
MTRPRDDLKIELVEASSSLSNAPGAGAVFDRFTSVQITNDIGAPSEALFEVGDDGSWRDISRFIAHGARYRVFINGKPRLTGRVEMSDIPVDSSAGAVIRFTVRTKVQDAWYAGANEEISLKKIKLDEFVYKLYEPLGYAPSDFILPKNSSLARDLMTGMGSTNKEPDRSLETLSKDAAKVRPPETIFEAADRHLRRHGFMHWDSPDGKIVIGTPNDNQPPRYYLIQDRANQGMYNNLLGNTRTQDWSGIPTSLGVYGVGGGRTTSRARVSASAEDADVIAAGFYRPVKLVAEAIKTKELATRAATREMSARSKSKDSFDIEVDGLSWWDGQRSIPYGVDTVAEVTTDVAGGRVGAYYIHRVISTRNATDGDRTNLTLCKKGVWKL